MELENFELLLRSNRRLASSEGTVWRAFATVRELVERSAELLLLWLAGRAVAARQLQVGGLVSFVYTASVGGRTQSALRRGQATFDQCRMFWARHAAMHQTALAPAAQICQLLTSRPSIGLDKPPLEQMPPAGQRGWGVEFDRVSFEYPERSGSLALEQVSFELPEGGVVGLIGPTGSGKSTVVGLLHRLYDPTSGLVRLGGLPLSAYNPLWLRRRVGVVSQDAVLFDLSLRDNLVYSCDRPDLISDATIEAALRMAGWPEVVEDRARFPEGLHTPAGESGVLLSGGERQRVAIARAVLKDPKLLLLDEATSALDERTQAAVQRALERMLPGRTCLMVAHRLSTLRRADWLVCLERGRVCEQGTPEQLLRAGGMYAEFIHHQTQGGPNQPRGASEADGAQ